MKFLVSFLVLTGLVSIYGITLSPEQKAKLKQHHQICHQEINADPKHIKNAKNGVFTDDPVFKNYVFCVLKRANLVNNHGRLNEEVLMAKIPKGTNMLAAQVITELCKSQKGVDAADTAYQMYKCYYEATPNHASLI